MKQIFPKEIIESTIETHLFRHGTKSKIIYLIILLSILTILVLLPFIYVDIYSTSRGIIKPEKERMQINAPITGKVKASFIIDNVQVKKGDTLLRFDTSIVEEQLHFMQRQMDETSLFIQDLDYLVGTKNIELSHIQSPKYKKEAIFFKQKRQELQTKYKKQKRDFERAQKLFDKGVIARTEYENEQLNLNIKHGNVTAIIGESGSGKSTLMSLLQKVYNIQSGKISIGDYDLNHITIESLRSVISVVPQKIDLFAGHVIDNIAVGDFSPEMEKIIEICKAIGILEFIENLPNGFETYIGENGATLSGGQKQRITIARALYKNPEVLILDEATSSLDSKSENFIQNTISTLKKEQKTIIIIAHRLSTVVNTDTIIVLNDGEVVESGTHQELFQQNGIYTSLWNQQIPKSN